MAMLNQELPSSILILFRLNMVVSISSTPISGTQDSLLQWQPSLLGADLALSQIWFVPSERISGYYWQRDCRHRRGVAHGPGRSKQCDLQEEWLRCGQEGRRGAFL